MMLRIQLASKVLLRESDFDVLIPDKFLLLDVALEELEALPQDVLDHLFFCLLRELVLVYDVVKDC